MDELDSTLKQLAESAKQHPPKSRARVKCIMLLIDGIQKSEILYCQRRFVYPLEVHNEAYRDALQGTLLYVSRSIDKYDPTRSKFMTWVNYVFNRKYEEAVEKYQKRTYKEVSLSNPINPYGKGDESSLLFEDTLPSKDPLLISELRQFIEQDFDGSFKSAHMRGRPEVNFQAIALRMLDGYTRREISDMWKVPEPGLYRFFSRCCENFKDKFTEYLSF